MCVSFGDCLVQLANERRSSLQEVGMVECSPFLELFDRMFCSEEEMMSALEKRPENYSELASKSI